MIKIAAFQLAIRTEPRTLGGVVEVRYSGKYLTGITKPLMANEVNYVCDVRFGKEGCTRS